MQKILPLLFLPFLCSCKEEATDHAPTLDLVRKENTVALSSSLPATQKASLWVNSQAVPGFRQGAEYILDAPLLVPGMNRVQLVYQEQGRADTLTDSVYFSRRVYYSLVSSYPHDKSHFTEGLFLEDDLLYESTGLEGQSGITRYRIAGNTIQPVDSVPVTDKKIFGEGIAAVGNRLFQLSWKNQRVFEYDKKTLRPVQQFSYPEEGWGLCRRGDSLIASDGKPFLYFIDPAGFRVYKKMEVRDENGPLANLNELEHVGRFVMANVWQTSRIVFIDEETGNVVADMDLANIVSSARQEAQRIDVLNGIAYDPRDHTFLVTGKLWPHIYRIRLDEKAMKFMGIE